MKIIFLKTIKTLFSLSIIFIFISCDKDDDLNASDVTGTYIGTLTGDFKSSQTATTVVSNTGDHIEVHCFSENFDETIILDIYDDEDRIMVCLTDDDFENMYGHMLDEGHMGHNGNEWMQHLNNEHQEGDEHFGFFEMQHHTFEFTFQMSEGDFHFQGTKD